MAEKEIAAGNDEQRSNETHEPKIYESGYFLISQQVNSLRDSMDTKFDSMRKEIDARFDKTDARFGIIDAKFDKIDEKFTDVRKEIKALSDKTDARFDKINDKVDSLQRWSIGSIVAIFVGTIGVIVTILLK